MKIGFKRLLLATAILGACAARADTYHLQIPSDSKANYTVLEKGIQGNLRTIITKREGAYGTTFSQRIYNCESHEVKYLGTGDTLEEMKNSKADAAMGPIVNQSIAYYVGLEACK